MTVLMVFLAAVVVGPLLPRERALSAKVLLPLCLLTTAALLTHRLA